MAVRGADRVVVATDDDRIRDHAMAFGAEVVMTSTACQNGTERCAEVAAKLPGFDIVVNLQGDAPLTPAWFIEDLVAGLRANPAAEIATPVLRCEGRMLAKLLEDRRNGQWVYYRLHPQLPEWVRDVLKRTLDSNAEWLRPDFQIWNLTHEMVHYLDGRFNLKGDFNDLSC